MKMPGADLMAEGKSVHAIIKAPVEAGQGNWCHGRSHREGGVIAEDIWGMTNRMDVLKTH